MRVAILAPLAAALLLWHRRESLSKLFAIPWWPGLLGLAASAALWMVGQLADINVLRQVAVVAMLLATALAVLGRSAARELGLPILFLLFGVNAYFPLVRPLMHLDAWLGVAALRFTGLPVELDGLTIVAPFGRWQVIEGCGGLDYVLIFAMSGLLFASLAFRSLIRRMLFVTAAILAALIANALRTWAIVFAAYARGGVDQDHSIIGWTAFAIVFALLFAIGRRFSQPASEPREVEVRAPARGDFRGSATLALAALAIAGAAPAASSALEARSRSAAGFDGCRVLQRVETHRDGISMLHARTECVGPSGIKQVSHIARTALPELPPGAALVTGLSRIERATPQGSFDAATLTALGVKVPYRLTYWYEVGGAETGSGTAMKWHLALTRLAGHDARVAVISELETPDSPR